MLKNVIIIAFMFGNPCELVSMETMAEHIEPSVLHIL